MIYVVDKCLACPAYHGNADGRCGCMPETREDCTVDTASAAVSRPTWCPLEQGAAKVYEAKDAGEASCADCSSMLIHACDVCPFFYATDKRRCNVANPKGRPIFTDDPRPTWCMLRKESLIIRKRAK